MSHGLSVINTHEKTGGPTKIHLRTVGVAKWILIVNGKKHMVQSDQSSYQSKNLGAEGQLSPPVSTKQTHVIHMWDHTLAELNNHLKIFF